MVLPHLRNCSQSMDFHQRPMTEDSRILVITPAHDEAQNLVELHSRLAAALVATDWCWLLVDDCSDDDTFTTAAVLSCRDERVGCIRLAERVGAHPAIFIALRLAAAWRFTAAVVLGADLEDPPEALPDLISAWRRGADVVFAARTRRTGVPLLHRTIGRMIHGTVRILLPGSGYPSCGTDLGVFGRRALALLDADPRPVGNVFVRIARLRLTSAVVPLPKYKKPHGWSGRHARVLARFARSTIAEACGLGVFVGNQAPAIAATAGWARRASYEALASG